MRQKPLVLIVDDEEAFLEIASVALHKKGLETAVAHSVPDALEKTARLQPDLVLSDIYMPPGPSGWEFALALHRNPATSNIKFAFFTSLRDPWAEAPLVRSTLAAELGSVTFLDKMDAMDGLGEKIELLVKG